MLTMQPISHDVLLEKYAQAGETTVAEVQGRIASALAKAEARHQRRQWAERFAWAQQRGFIPAGRIASAAGSGLGATLINCFVQPVADAIRGRMDGRPGIYTALGEAAETMRRGGGVGYNFSLLRPKGALVKGTGGHSSGPLSYMDVFDCSCATVESAGFRRGAQMAVLDVAHPDILDFITAKGSAGRLTNFNLSVGVSDAFMQAVLADDPWQLLHTAEPGAAQKSAGAWQSDDGRWVYRQLPARQVWDAIMRATYDCAEPGVLFLDRIASENNLAYCETIAATNPCGEQPLPDYGCCCLGSLDLTRFVTAPFEAGARVDWTTLADVIAVAVRMLDNVLTLTPGPCRPSGARPWPSGVSASVLLALAML
jgi:ribonucleoside-diphosphate reductase alpha chain